MEKTQTQLLEKLTKDKSLNDVQKYIKEVIEIRGFSKQPIEETLLLLTEEVGELAKSIRKEKGMTVDEKRIKNYDTPASEVADVFIVLASICNTLKIDLFDAIKMKETINVSRSWTKKPTGL